MTDIDTFKCFCFRVRGPLMTDNDTFTRFYVRVRVRVRVSSFFFR